MIRAKLVGLDELGCAVKRFIRNGIRNLKQEDYFGKPSGKILFKKPGHNSLCPLAI